MTTKTHNSVASTTGKTGAAAPDVSASGRGETTAASRGSDTALPKVVEATEKKPQGARPRSTLDQGQMLALRVLGASPKVEKVKLELAGTTVTISVKCKNVEDAVYLYRSL